MAATMPPSASILLDVVASAALDFVGQRLDEIRSAERVGRVRDAAFVRDDLLGAQREGGGGFGGQRPGFVERIGVQRLRAAQHGRQRLQRRAHDVVVGLLRGERTSRRLRVEPQRPRARILRAEALAHHALPDAPRGAVLGDLLEEIVVRVEEKRKPRREIVHLQSRGGGTFSTYSMPSRSVNASS